ncbi:MAG: endonuclease/exonuclease/phosphatase family protein [Armatimonadota bacterium]
MKPRKHDILFGLTLLNAAALLTLLVIEYAVAEHRWWSTLLTYMPQHPFIVLPAILLFIALILRRWRSVVWNALAITLCTFTLLGVNIPFGSGGKDGIAVRAMTMNVHALSGGVDHIARVISLERPDVLFLQEVSERGANTPSPALRRQLQGWHYAGEGEVAIFSRYPIRDVQIHRMPQYHRVMLEAIVAIKGTPLTVIDVHLSTSATSESLTNRRSSLPAYLRRTTAARSAQIENLLRIAGKSPHPVLIAGDFNTPPRGVLYRRLTRQFQDGFHAAGWGAGYTYSTHIPMMRIDYLFADKKIAVRRCYRPPYRASDHYPMVADLVVLR